MMYCSSMFMRPFRERDRERERSEMEGRKFGSMRGKERKGNEEERERKGQAMGVVGWAVPRCLLNSEM